MALLTNFSFEVFYEIFTEDASLLLLYHGAKNSKMTKNSNPEGLALIVFVQLDGCLSDLVRGGGGGREGIHRRGDEKSIGRGGQRMW